MKWIVGELWGGCSGESVSSSLDPLELDLCCDLSLSG